MCLVSLGEGPPPTQLLTNSTSIAQQDKIGIETSWVEINTRRSLTGYCHGQTLLTWGKLISFIANSDSGSEKQRQKMNQRFSTLTSPRPKFSPLIWTPLAQGVQGWDGGCSQSIPAPLGLSSLLTHLPVPVQALSCNKVNIWWKL